MWVEEREEASGRHQLSPGLPWWVRLGTSGPLLRGEKPSLPCVEANRCPPTILKKEVLEKKASFPCQASALQPCKMDVVVSSCCSNK